MSSWRYGGAFQVAFVTALVGVTWLSLVPDAGPFTTPDKVSHALGYFALGFLADFAFPSRSYPFAKALPLLVYGIVIELVQSRIPGRFAEGTDVAANMAGLALFWLCLPALKRVPVLRARWKV